MLRPDVGKIFKIPASSRINMMPSQKLGILMPKRPKLVPRLSIHELGLEPAITPKGIAKRVAMIIEKKASSIVAGRRVLMTLATGSPYLKDLPNSPAAAEAMN